MIYVCVRARAVNQSYKNIVRDRNTQWLQLIKQLS